MTPRATRCRRIREAEQRAASAVVGVHDVRFVEGHSDGWLEPGWELQREIVRVLREVRPQRVLTQSPERGTTGCRPPTPTTSPPARPPSGRSTRPRRTVSPSPSCCEEGLEPWHVGELWLMAHPQMGHPVDITDTFPRKVKALQQHTSQTAHLGDGLETMLRAWAVGNAATAGLAEGRLAEAFTLSRLR